MSHLIVQCAPYKFADLYGDIRDKCKSFSEPHFNCKSNSLLQLVCSREIPSPSSLSRLNWHVSLKIPFKTILSLRSTYKNSTPGQSLHIHEFHGRPNRI